MTSLRLSTVALVTLINLQYPLIALAQSETLSPTPVPTPTLDVATKLIPVMDQLNLTSQQQDQMMDMARSTQTQIQAILTEPQQQSIQASLQNGATLRSAFMTLGLTRDQALQIHSVFQDLQNQMQVILTPDQLAQMEELRQTRRNGFQ